MRLTKIEDFLSVRLSQPLPGSVAHLPMRPKLVNGSDLRIKHSKEPRKGGVLILLYEEQGMVKFPLIQRPEYEGVHSGQIALPGGKHEDADSDVIQTAIREAHEEVGVVQTDVKVLGTLSEFFVEVSNFMVTPVIASISYKPAFVPEATEVSEIITPSIMALIDEPTMKEKVISVRSGIDLLCKYYDLEQKVVWGATATMLNELVVLLREFRDSEL